MKNYLTALFFLIIIFFFINGCTAQSGTTDKLIKSKFTIYCTAGPNFYINNLMLAKNYVNVFNYSISGRLMWEPEYNLSLGIESGYNKLFSMDIDFGNSRGSVHIANVAIPIQMVIAMKFFKDYYCNFSMGPSIIVNKVRSTDYGNFDASSVSFADFSFSIGHKQLISERIYLGTEIKGFYSSKLDDKNISLLFMGGFRF